MTFRNERAGDVVVVILGGGRGARLDPLTRLRSKPAVPIAGNYRLIDIPISNAINSGMNRIFVLTQFNSVSLHRHINATYKFDPFSRGFVEILAAQQTVSDDSWYQGTADAVRHNVRLIEALHGEFVLILAGDHMYRMDYRAMLAEHVACEAEISIAVHPSSAEEISDFGAVRVDAGGRVVEFREKPADAAARAGMEVDPGLLREHGLGEARPYLASMGIYLFRKRALIELLESDAADFGRHLLPRAVEDRKVMAHLFDGYWRDIGTIRAFYDAHIDLVRPQPPFDFYEAGWPFYTHPRYLPGARLTGTRFEQSILANGSLVENSHIEEAIVGIRSRVRGARLYRSLVMGADPDPPAAPRGAPPIGIGEGSVVEHAIVDKNARIGRNVRITNAQGLQEGEGEGWVIRDGVVVVPKNAIVPDGTEV